MVYVPPPPCVYHGSCTSADLIAYLLVLGAGFGLMFFGMEIFFARYDGKWNWSDVNPWILAISGIMSFISIFFIVSVMLHV